MIRKLILASASPRRRELITLIGMPFEVVPSRFDEPSPPTSAVNMKDLVTNLALSKASEVARRLRDSTVAVVGADTLVTLSPIETGVPLGKPGTREEAVCMLNELSGVEHYVYTGVAIVIYQQDGAFREMICCERTGVKFRALTPDLIDDYVNTGEPMDKAGSYGAQGYAAPFIEGFAGDFYNVVGLPLCLLTRMLEESGISWHRQRGMLDKLIG